MKPHFKGLLPLLFAALAVATAASTGPFAFPRSTPEAEGISSAAILEFINQVEPRADGMNSFMLVRHGKVVAEGWWTPYAADEPHMMYSLSKSFTSTAVGFAVAEGRLSVDDPVSKFFPDYAPAEPDANLRALRVKDLLTMSTGQHPEGIETFRLEDKGDLVAKFFSISFEHKPGTFFHYNSGATFILSVIVQQLTGHTVRDYLMPRLFEPLGIAPPKWDETAQGFSYGASGLHIRTEDIARFGQLYLQKGEWQGKQLLPQSWIEEATAKQVSNGSDPTGNWDQGYGYQFWRCPHSLYRGDGAFGQYCIVINKHDTVLAMTCGTRDMGTVMNTAWEILLPALRDGPLPADPEAHAALRAKLGSLKVPAQTGTASTNVAADVIGKRYAFLQNMVGIVAITLDSIDPDGVASFTFEWNGVRERYTAGPGEWRRGGAFHFPSGPTPVAASGAWTDVSFFTLKLCAYQTPFTITHRLRFTGKQLIVEAETNVAFGDRTLPAITGAAE